jgi:hypothetical protein
VAAVRDHLAEFDDCAVAVVTFADPADLDAYREHLALPFPVLTDPDRSLYRELGFERAGWRTVYNRGTLTLYARLLRQGRRLRRPVEDTRQLGGDAVYGPDGELSIVFRPPSPDARPSIAELVAAVQRARG